MPTGSDNRNIVHWQDGLPESSVLLHTTAPGTLTYWQDGIPIATSLAATLKSKNGLVADLIKSFSATPLVSTAKVNQLQP